MLYLGTTKKSYFTNYIIGFYHEATRLDRDEYIEINFDAIKAYEISYYGYSNNQTQKEFVRCDLTKRFKTLGCQIINRYDVESILHYPAQLIDEANNKTFTVITVKNKTKLMCGEEGCNVGQRNGLSVLDVDTISKLYGCG